MPRGGAHETHGFRCLAIGREKLPAGNFSSKPPMRRMREGQIMARKNLLDGLGSKELPAGNSEHESISAPLPPPVSRGPRGAIGAISRTIETLVSQAEGELDPSVIDPPPFQDRLAESPAAFADFLEGVREAGQQVPILVRPHPEKEGRYQFAFGRRRLRAARELNRKVRAIIKPLSDAELVIAQGQENAKRKDLSFIERALYSAELERQGIARDTIMKSLGVDKTGLSRLISVAEEVPTEVVIAIGSAPKAGRDRWLELAARLRAGDAMARANDITSSASFQLMESDERFAHLFSALAKPRVAATRLQSWRSQDGTRAARFKRDKVATTIVIDHKAAPDFGDFVLSSLSDLYEAYRAARVANGKNEDEEGS